MATLSLDSIPGASDALKTIIEKVGLWQQLGPKLVNMGAQAMTVQNAGRNAGNAAVVQAMSLVMNQLSGLQQAIQGSTATIGSVTTAIAEIQKGDNSVITPGLIADAVGLAFTITNGLNNAEAQQQQIVLAAAKVMTPAAMTAAGIGGEITGGSADKSWTTWLLYAALGYGGWKLLRGVVRGH